jgi:inosine-uridine nucleoside N-ribohydrolase
MSGKGKTALRGVSLYLAGSFFVVVVLLIAAKLAMPVREWRTGEYWPQPLPSLDPAAMPPAADRIWIDTDAACGAGATIDPDDCLAILHLAGRTDIAIAGMSSVSGNAELAVTDRTARKLADLIARQAGRVIPVHRGGQEAVAALAGALADGPLTIVALGPLSNVAMVLETYLDLHANIERIVAVMGRRPGHVFHPSEGNGRGMLLGHGPIFRDFNVAMDPDAVRAVLSSEVSIVLVPYEAAREVEVDGADLRQISEGGPANRWVADRSRAWLAYWNEDIGRSGFYPFDLLAAAFVVAPQRFACAAVSAAVGRDEAASFPFSRARALLVETEHARVTKGESPGVLYCHGLRDGSAGLRWMWPDAARLTASRRK